MSTPPPASPQALQAVNGLLNSADIINLPDPPAQIGIGEVIKPRLSLEQSALDALAAVRELASIDLSAIDLQVSLNNLTSTVTSTLTNPNEPKEPGEPRPPNINLQINLDNVRANLNDIKSTVTSTLKDPTDETKVPSFCVDLTARAPAEENKPPRDNAAFKVVFKDVEHSDPELKPPDISADTTPAGKLPYVNPVQFNDPTDVLPGYLTYTDLIENNVKGVVGKIAGLVGHLTTFDGTLKFPSALKNVLTGTFETTGSTLVAATKLDFSAALKNILMGTLGTRVKTVDQPSGAKHYLPIVLPPLLPEIPHLEVTWTLQDESGRALRVGEHFLLLDNTTLDSPIPTLVFLPIFTEYDPAAPNLAQVRISCRVRIHRSTPQQPPVLLVPERTIGPHTVAIPKLQIPTVLALTEHAMGREDFPGSLLLMVPETSALKTPADLSAQFQAVKSVLNLLIGSLRTHGIPDTDPLLDKIRSVRQHIDQLLDFLHPSREAWRTTQIANSIKNLWWVPRKPGIHVLGWLRAISAVFLFGPPGCAVLCHIPADLSWDEGHFQGVFQVTVGTMPVAVVPDLSNPPIHRDPIPVDGRFEVHLVSRLFEGFNDTISSLQLI